QVGEAEGSCPFRCARPRLTSGIRPGQRQVLESMGVLELLRLEGSEYDSTPEAIRGARTYLECTGVLPLLPAQESRTAVREETEETVG
ncbi:hypothetical protein G6048_01785, partial [Streptomyces sp. YC419]|nr:hypothetical protein [Streptomyces ureilyticus]